MASVTTKAALSPARARLVEMMQGLNFGSITGLFVREGEPVLDPPPRVLREVKLCAENGPRSEVNKEDFALKAQVRDLFTEMETMNDGVIRSLEVKHGLPFKMIIEEDAA